MEGAKVGAARAVSTAATRAAATGSVLWRCRMRRQRAAAAAVGEARAWHERVAPRAPARPLALLLKGLLTMLIKPTSDEPTLAHHTHSVHGCSVGAPASQQDRAARTGRVAAALGRHDAVRGAALLVDGRFAALPAAQPRGRSPAARHMRCPRPPPRASSATFFTRSRRAASPSERLERVPAPATVTARADGADRGLPDRGAPPADAARLRVARDHSPRLLAPLPPRVATPNATLPSRCAPSWPRRPWRSTSTSGHCCTCAASSVGGGTRFFGTRTGTRRHARCRPTSHPTSHRSSTARRTRWRTRTTCTRRPARAANAWAEADLALGQYAPWLPGEAVRWGAAARQQAHDWLVSRA